MSKPDPVIDYYMADFPRTLFPLDTNLLLIQHAGKSLGEFIHQSIGHKEKSQHAFLTQAWAYAAKSDFHLRRTMKLDAIAEYYLYEMTHKYRTKFRKSHKDDKRNFGYRFAGGKMVPPATSYREFRSAVRKNLASYKFCLKADVSQYFNSIYHHDLVNWFRDLPATEEDAELFGKFFREINGGRSVDCLPHGIYPAKIIGSQFIRFVEDSSEMRALASVRFMDDIYIFDNDAGKLASEFQVLQRLLGSKGLTVNASKTKFGNVNELDIRREVSEVKKRLLSRRGEVVLASGADEDYWDEDEQDLSPDEMEYLLSLLRSESLEEEDAELILMVMRDHAEDVFEYFEKILANFPSLSKNIYQFGRCISDKSALTWAIAKFLRESSIVTEYQLFWLAKLAQDALLETREVGDLLIALYSHPASTSISRGKILEIPERRFGIPELQEKHIREGASSWPAWCAAMGCRSLPKAKRNHMLGYFGNGSWYNSIISNCVRTIPDAKR